jgi:hypothetical protein
MLRAELGIGELEVRGAIARKAAERVAAAAAVVAPEEIGNPGGDRRSEVFQSRGKLPLDPVPVPQPVPQAERAERAGIGERTQRKLDKLARERPDLHVQVAAGVKSAQAAAIEAGFEVRKVGVPVDPGKAVAEDDRGASFGPLFHKALTGPNSAAKGLARSSRASLVRSVNRRFGRGGFRR